MPCTWVGLQLEVSQICHDNGVDHNGFVFGAQNELQATWRSTSRRIKAMAFKQQIFEFVFAVNGTCEANVPPYNTIAFEWLNEACKLPLISTNLMLSKSYTDRTTSTSQFSGTCKFCVNNGLAGRPKNFAYGPADALPSARKRNSGSITYR